MLNDMANDNDRIDTRIHAARPSLLALSGFSGAGKTTIREHILRRIPESRFSLSVTTRPKRADEQDGIDYQFISKDEFNSLVADNRLLEWEEVHGHFYGTPLQPVEDAHKKPGLIIFDVDVHGGLSIKKRFPEAILVFLQPPSLEVLKERLEKRHTDSPEEIDRRLQRIPNEVEMSRHYDHIITNINIKQAVDEICTIIREFQNKIG